MEPVSLAEWAQMAFLSAAVYAAVMSPLLFLGGAEVWAWPRPLVAAVDRVHAVVESGAVDPLLIVVGPVWASARAVAAIAREFARDAAALLILLCTSPKGAMS